MNEFKFKPGDKFRHSFDTTVYRIVRLIKENEFIPELNLAIDCPCYLSCIKNNKFFYTPVGDEDTMVIVSENKSAQEYINEFAF